MSFYSQKSSMLQQKFGTKPLAEKLKTSRRHSELSYEDKEIIKNSEFFFLATTTADGQPDCSIKGGNPGFVEIYSKNKIGFRNYDGNGMFRSLGNILENSKVGLLFIQFFPDKKKLRINGNAHLDYEKSGQPDEILILIEIRDIFPNCPRYLPDLTIHRSSPYNPAAGYTPPEPAWKSKPDLKPFVKW
tara:strand:- start:231 stop:794 length:564 start_codon:yes stop_codon:yes gene_type:complete